MSYEFTIRAATKAGAKVAVEAELDAAFFERPNNEADLAYAKATAASFIDMMPENRANDIVVKAAGGFNGSGVKINVVFVAKAGTP